MYAYHLIYNHYNVVLPDKQVKWLEKMNYYQKNTIP